MILFNSNSCNGRAIHASCIGVVLLLAASYAFAKSTKVGLDQTAIASLATAIEQFKVDTGDYPSTERGLQVLVSPEGISNAQEGGYIQRLSASAWGSEYQYLYPGIRNPGGFDLWSLGKDGLPGGSGFDSDCGNWPDGFKACFDAQRKADRTRMVDVLPLTIAWGTLFCFGVFLVVSYTRKLLGTKSPECYKGKTLWISLLALSVFVFLALPLLIY